MAKRFTATEKWDDPWYSNLSPADRNFWDFICDKCDIAGIWQVNPMLVRAYFGPDFCLPDFGDRIVKITNDKWFIKKFIEFQYGKLSPAVRFHSSIIEILKKHRLLDSLSDRVLDRPKDKDTLGQGQGKDTKRTKEPELSTYSQFCQYNDRGQGACEVRAVCGSKYCEHHKIKVRDMALAKKERQGQTTGLSQLKSF